MDDAALCTEVRTSHRGGSKRIELLTGQLADVRRRNGVLRRRNRRLEKENRRLHSINARLREQLREYQGPARATASNSSLPPSANPPGAAKPVVKKPSGRPSGAQLGHKGHGRGLLPAERVNEVVHCRPTGCECCGAALPPSPGDRVEARYQQAELPKEVVWVTEHQAIACTCVKCGWVSRGQIPSHILRSVCGPRLSAAMAYLSAYSHVSRRGVEEVLSNLLGMKLSLGSVFAREREMAAALAGPYREIRQQVRQAAVKYVDETGWKRAAQWLWVAASSGAVLFLCSHARTVLEMFQLLGQVPRGVICSDRQGVYDKYPRRRRGLCWSHLKRDFQRCVDRGGKGAKIGREALAITREVFHRWRWFRRGRISRATLRRELRPLRKKMKQLLTLGAESGIAKTAGLCRRLLKLEGAMWRFAQVPGLEPTNNLAERMLRPAVIWRKKSFGSASHDGCRFVERMLSVTATIRLRRGNVLEYLTAAVAAHREGRPAPGLDSVYLKRH